MYPAKSANGFCRKFILADGGKVSSIFGMNESPGDEECEDCADYAEQHAGIVRDAREAGGAAGELLEVVQKHTNTLTEAKTGDEEVVTLELQGQGSQQESYEPGHRRTDNHGKKEVEAMPDNQNGSGISPDGHKTRVAKGEEPGKSRQDRHTENGDDVDAHQDDNTLNVWIDVKEAADGVIDVIESIYHNAAPPLCLVLNVDTEQTTRLDEKENNEQRE